MPNLIWNWALLIILIGLAVLFAADLWRLYRFPKQEGDKALIVSLSIKNRWLYLLVVAMLILSRLDRMC